MTSSTGAPGNGEPGQPKQPDQPGEPGPTKPPEPPEKPEQPEQPEQPERPERPEKPEEHRETDPPAPSQRSGQEKVSRQRAEQMTATLFDQRPGTQGQSVHDRITQSAGNKSLADTLTASPAGDLKKLIGINEKYKFVNELFDGNLKAYNECIGKLNDAGTLSDAAAVLEETVIGRFEADKESETFLSLNGLVQKRFTR